MLLFYLFQQDNNIDGEVLLSLSEEELKVELAVPEEDISKVRSLIHALLL